MDPRKDRDFLIEFLEMYRNYPCLWRIKSSEYKDRSKKNKTYEELVKKYREVDTSATVQTVKSKIDSIRGSFGKEFKKMKECQRSDAGEEETYKPHLWCFDNLLFLLDQETPRESVSSLETDSLLENTASMSQYETSEELISPRSEESTNLYTQLSSLDTTPTHSSLASSSTSKCLMSKRELKVNKADEVLEKLSKQLDVKEDKFDVSGKNIANKLRELPNDVPIITEKLINIIFEAQMGNITRHSKIVLQDTRETSNFNMYPSQGNMPLTVQHFQPQPQTNIVNQSEESVAAFYTNLSSNLSTQY